MCSLKLIRIALLALCTYEEVKRAMFSIDSNKAPGLDGFRNFFFRYTWHIIRAEVTTVVLEFFQHGNMLKAHNATLVTLITMKTCPKNVSEF